MPRLYIDLGYELNEQDLITYFSNYGRVSGVYLPRHDSGRSVGYAFATIHPVRPSIDPNKIAPGTLHTIRGYRISIQKACLDRSHRPPKPALRRPSVPSAHRQNPHVHLLPGSQISIRDFTWRTQTLEDRPERAVPAALSAPGFKTSPIDAVASFARRWYAPMIDSAAALAHCLLLFL